MFKTLKYCWIVFTYTWEANGSYTLIFVFGHIYGHTLYPFIQVALLAKLLDVFSTTQTVTFMTISWILAAYISANLLNIIFRQLSNANDEFVQEKLLAHLDHKIIQKLTELDPATFEKSEFQNLLAQLDSVKGSMQAHLAKFTAFLTFIVKFVTAAIVVGTIFPFFVPLVIIAAIPIFLAWKRARVRVWPFFVEKRSIVLRITSYIQTLLSSDSTSKEAAIFKTGNVLIDKVDKKRQVFFKDMEKALIPGTRELIFAKLFQLAVFIGTQFFTLSAVLSRQISIGQFALLFQQTLNLTEGAEDVLNQYSSIDMRTKYLDKFFEFMNTKKVIVSPAHPKEIPTIPTPPSIEFKNVSFKYPKTDRYILKNFSLTIASGEKIALVGENGAGKTTIIKLLLRFYDVTEGEILINQQNIKEVSLEDWHTFVGALFQDFIKYQFTFKENIILGNLSKKDDENLLKEALTKSGSHAVLENLPKGTNQILGKTFDDGIDLSGGQWQKLALARTFFRDAPVLILDEPTSAIDAKAEYEIFEHVQHLQKDKTVIIISHRFSTVRNADRILVLEDGKIVEEGTHEALLNAKGLYEELFTLQAKGYK